MSDRRSSAATRTTNPLHFEDLEPHRFEDLVRQLAYGLRDWQQLEAIGRAGKDDGADIRAIEVGVESGDADYDEDDPDSRAEPVRSGGTRTWLIQCKREKAIGPAKARRYGQELVPDGSVAPDVAVLAAACDFSKSARDAFREEALTRGVTEVHLWGKAELEDLLFLAENDRLLFAYFNISLQVRRRTLAGVLRSRLATKRKLVRVLGEIGDDGYKHVLVRDPSDERYPYDTTSSGERIPATALGWRELECHGSLVPDALVLETTSYPAWINDDRTEYDFALIADPRSGNLRRRYESPPDDNWDLWGRVHHWIDANVERANSGRYVELVILNYDDILVVDEIGDIEYEAPHLLVAGPLEKVLVPGRPQLVLGHHTDWRPAEDLKRVSFFPSDFPATDDAASSRW